MFIFPTESTELTSPHDFKGYTFKDLQNFFSKRIGEQIIVQSQNEMVFKEPQKVEITSVFERFVVVKKSVAGKKPSIHTTINFGAVLAKDDSIELLDSKL